MKKSLLSLAVGAAVFVILGSSAQAEVTVIDQDKTYNESPDDNGNWIYSHADETKGFQGKTGNETLTIRNPTSAYNSYFYADGNNAKIVVPHLDTFNVSTDSRFKQSGGIKGDQNAFMVINGGSTERLYDV